MATRKNRAPKNVDPRTVFTGDKNKEVTITVTVPENAPEPVVNVQTANEGDKQPDAPQGAANVQEQAQPAAQAAETQNQSGNASEQNAQDGRGQNRVGRYGAMSMEKLGETVLEQKLPKEEIEKIFTDLYKSKGVTDQDFINSRISIYLSIGRRRLAKKQQPAQAGAAAPQEQGEKPDARFGPRPEGDPRNVGRTGLQGQEQGQELEAANK